MSLDGVNQEEINVNNIEIKEWLDSLDYVLTHGSKEQAQKILAQLQIHAQKAGVTLPFTVNTPYINTIHHAEQPVMPGDRDIERRIKSLVRWHAMGMDVRGNRAEAGIGRDISTYA